MFWWTLFLLAIGAIIYRHFKGCCKGKKADVEKYRKDGWFGNGSVKDGQTIPKDSTEIRPFEINIPNSDLEDLQNRLTNSRYVDPVEDTQFTYGFNSKYLKEVVKYWRTKYDWRKEEAKLNSVPQFKTQIEGIDIHFIRVKPSKPAKTVLPLLVIHGWPGSVLEYYKSFPLLTEPDQNGLVFEVIAPSIPGYGYSEAPHQKGFNGTAAARVFVKLMKRLGHEKFVVHGGDWGSYITRLIAITYADSTIGAHILGNWGQLSKLAMAKIYLAQYFPSLFFSPETRQRDLEKLFPLKEKKLFAATEFGYMQLQSTKPDTVGAGLVDSPVGLAAYILEKFSTWTNPAYRNREDGGLTEKFTLDELLTNIMIYWTSGNITSSQRFYKENRLWSNDIAGLKIHVPFATVDTPYELIRMPRAFIESKYSNLVQYTDLARGGHFTAFEEPELVVEDIRSFVKKVIGY